MWMLHAAKNMNVTLFWYKHTAGVICLPSFQAVSSHYSCFCWLLILNLKVCDQAVRFWFLSLSLFYFLQHFRRNHYPGKHVVYLGTRHSFSLKLLKLLYLVKIKWYFMYQQCADVIHCSLLYRTPCMWVSTRSDWLRLSAHILLAVEYFTQSRVTWTHIQLRAARLGGYQLMWTRFRRITDWLWMLCWPCRPASI